MAPNDYDDFDEVSEEEEDVVVEAAPKRRQEKWKVFSMKSLVYENENGFWVG